MPIPLWIAASLVLAASCNGAYGAELDAEALDRGGDIAYRAALKGAAEAKKFNTDAQLTTRVRRVANRIVAAAPRAEPAARAYAWTVNVVVDPRPIAVMYPHGRMVIADGLLRSTGFSDDELAAVVAYASAHELLGHDFVRIAEHAGKNAHAADPNRRALAIAEATAATLARPGYTPAEMEAADRMSVDLLARAAYDPRAAGRAWRKLAKSTEGLIENAPVSQSRLAAMDAAAIAAMPVYEKVRADAAAQAASPQRPPIGGMPRAVPR